MKNCVDVKVNVHVNLISFSVEIWYSVTHSYYDV